MRMLEHWWEEYYCLVNLGAHTHAYECQKCFALCSSEFRVRGHLLVVHEIDVEKVPHSV